MLKTLLKKQLTALLSSIRMNRRRGTMRSKGAIAGFALLFIFMFISIAFAFFGMGQGLASVLLPGKEWLFLTIMGMIALVLSVVGSVFSTYSTLYKAKDNELMLSLPIQPGSLLLSKMVTVYLTALLFSALVMLPAILTLAMHGAASGLNVLFSILTTLLIALLASALSCILGWLVALVVGIFPNKNAASVIATLVFLVAYYIFYFRINSILRGMIANMDSIEAAISQSGIAYPVIMMGRGAAGNLPSFLIFAGICMVLFAIVYVVLSRTFTRILTRTEKLRTKTYVAKTVKEESIGSALLKKELRHLLGLPAYMLNCCLASFLMLLAAVALLIYSGTVRSVVDSLRGTELDFLLSYLPLLLGGMLCFICTMNDLTAPSISLEAKTLWLIKSLPTGYRSVLSAKLRLHELMTAIPALVLLIAAAVVFRLSLLEAIAAIAMTLLFVTFSAAAGLAINLKLPNLNWTNETVAVKQSGSVFITMFGGWILMLLLGGGYALFLRTLIPPMIYMYILCGLFLAGTLLLQLWLYRRGTKILAAL